MNIQPNGSVIFCADVEIDRANQRDFKTKQEQVSFFSGQAVYQAQKVSFIKTNEAWSGTVKVPCPYYTLANCNYLYFTNTGFSAKTYFCYITGVRYIDTATTQVTFSLDFFQTFLFDYSIKRNTIVRRHFSTIDTMEFRNNFIDEISVNGLHKIKDVESIEYSMNPRDGQEKIVLLVGVLSAAAEKLLPIFQAEMDTVFNNAFFPGRVMIFDLTIQTADDVATSLQEISKDHTVTFAYFYPNIGGIFTNPTYAPNGDEDAASCPSWWNNMAKGTRFLKKQQEHALLYQKKILSTHQNINIPAKLRQAPFQKYSLQFSNGEGITDLNAAMMNNPNALTLYIVPKIFDNPSVTVFVSGYGGKNTYVEDDFQISYNYKIVTSDFPNFSYATYDNRSILAGLGELGSIFVNAGVGAVTAGNAASDAMQIDPDSIKWKMMKEPEQKAYMDSQNAAWSSAALGSLKNVPVAGQFVSAFTKMNPPPQYHQNGGGSWVSAYVFQISLLHYELTSLSTIQAYCERYGFSCYDPVTIFKPQRPRYDFVKCADIEITGRIPVEAKNSIAQDYINGITLWHDNDIFNYENN